MSAQYTTADVYLCCDGIVVMDSFMSTRDIDIKTITDFYQICGTPLHKFSEYELHEWSFDRTTVINDESMVLNNGARIIFAAKQYAIGDFSQQTIDSTKPRDIFESCGDTFHSVMNCYR
ncbi:hypothetical protein GGI20_005160 [Coemansia sp. BCRC 34301]|nr:hypothetical protein GGI20_005160 [Coemansia sp. BCRC 34301]